jgi:prepilin-type N-terminal cleavage/methylation domain-containing protein
MTHRQRRHNRRPAFTLVELMVVMTIIAILVALLTGAVMRALTKGPELETSSEIGELQSKISSSARDVNLDYLPSRLHLSKQNFYPNKGVAGSLDSDSVRFLQNRFGRSACFNFTPLSGNNFIDWNGDGVANEELYLEGEQCLVFHLGGVPLPSGGNIVMVGFSLNPSNPAAGVVNGQHRNGPFFEFQSNRLKSFTSTAFQGANFPTQAGGSYGSFPVYLDPWTQTGGIAKRQPFAFFASYSVEGGGLYSDATHKYGSSDCPFLPVLPYVQSTSGGVTVYVNPSNFQIISAGKNGKFGAGGTNWGRTGTTDPNGKDDQSNFSSHLLGVAP